MAADLLNSDVEIVRLNERSAPTSSVDLVQLGFLLGHFGTLCFTLQYLPQIYKNYKRKSVVGFSTTGIIIKLIGAAFLWMNAFLLGEPLPVVLYGAFNVVQHTLFIVQFVAYTRNKSYIPWILFPIIPFYTGIQYPETMNLTNSIKPLTQILSHFPQLIVCVQMKSVSGVSMFSQHLNLLGGIAGLMMCYCIPPKSYSTYLIYLNSLFQAISMYVVGFMYEGFRSLQLDMKSLMSLGTADVTKEKVVQYDKIENHDL